MPTPLTVATRRNGVGALVLSATGEIDLSNIDDFDDALAAAVSEVQRNGETLVVDLSAVEYLDSAAINALCLRSEHIRVIAPALLMPTLKMSGLTELATVETAPSQPSHEL